jgi:hypothetical protein
MGRGRYGEPRSRAPELGLLVQQEDNANRVHLAGNHLGAGDHGTGGRKHPSAGGHEQ